jgi:uroporphyrinogen-III synthase
MTGVRSTPSRSSSNPPLYPTQPPAASKLQLTTMPLNNKRILITRTRHQASSLAAQLEALGATTLLIPTIEIIPPATYAPLDAALAQLDRYDWLLFTSANAVEVFHHRLHSPQASPPVEPRVQFSPDSPKSSLNEPQIRVPHFSGDRIVAKMGNCASDPPSFTESQKTTEQTLPRIAVIGPATARAVQGIGLPVALIPPHYIAESLAEALTSHAPGSHMLLIRAEQARDLLPEALTAAGATVTIVDAYRNQIPPDSIPALQSVFAGPATYPDAITFTSASTASNLLALLEAAGLSLPAGITLASIGPITSRALRDLGLIPTVEAAEPTITALIQSVLTHFTHPH